MTAWQTVFPELPKTPIEWFEARKRFDEELFKAFVAGRNYERGERGEETIQPSLVDMKNRRLIVGIKRKD